MLALFDLRVEATLEESCDLAHRVLVLDRGLVYALEDAIGVFVSVSEGFGELDELVIKRHVSLDLSFFDFLVFIVLLFLPALLLMLLLLFEKVVLEVKATAAFELKDFALQHELFGELLFAAALGLRAILVRLECPDHKDSLAELLVFLLLNLPILFNFLLLLVHVLHLLSIVLR